MAKSPDVQNSRAEFGDPYCSWSAITPHDTDPQPGGPWRGISWTGAGAVALVDTEGVALTIIPNGALAANVIHKLCFGRVLATGTAATGIIGYK